MDPEGELSLSFEKTQEDFHSLNPLDTGFNVLNRNVFCYFKIKKSLNLVRHKSVYVMSTNVLCKCINEFIPIEIAIVKFNLERGIEERYHRFVHPVRVPMGYRGQAKRHSESTHELPIEEWIEGSTSDFCTVLKEVVKFLSFDFNKTTDITHCNPVVLSLPNQIRQNRRVIKYICDQAQQQLKRKTDISHCATSSLSSEELDYIELSTRLPIIDVYEYFSKCLAASGKFRNYDEITRSIGAVNVPDGIENCDFHAETDKKICALGFASQLCKSIHENISVYFQ